MLECSSPRGLNGSLSRAPSPYTTRNGSDPNKSSAFQTPGTVPRATRVRRCTQRISAHLARFEERLEVFSEMMRIECARTRSTPAEGQLDEMTLEDRHRAHVDQDEGDGLAETAPSWAARPAARIIALVNARRWRKRAPGPNNVVAACQDCLDRNRRRSVHPIPCGRSAGLRRRGG